MKKFFSIVVLLTALLISACSAGGANQDDGRVTIVTTIGQLADAARNVGGDLVNVTELMGAGVDPHLYIATEGDVSLLQEADIIFYNGLFLEAQMDDILQQIGGRKISVPVSEHIDEADLLASPLYEDEHDPHVWFDVLLWMGNVEVIRDTLIDFDPEHADEYRANAEAYLAELQELHAYVEAQAQRLNEEKRVLITAHDAFNYFGRRYGFEVLGLQGISTQSEASTADVRDMAALIVEREVPAVFIESSVPVRTVEALREAVAALGYDVAIGGELFSDAMGTPGTPEGSYIGMVRHNIDTIVGALLAGN